MDKPIILLDFDETLYRKDSLLQFHLYCIRKYPILLIWLPLQVCCWLLHRVKLITTQQFKNCYLLFLAFRSVETIEEDARGFWGKEFPEQFIKPVLQVLYRTDVQCVVITASPVIYFRPLLSLLPAITLIGTELTTTNGIYLIQGKNCKGPEKVAAFRKQFPQAVNIVEAYSDSLSDTPMLALAQQAFLVNGDTITPFRG